MNKKLLAVAIGAAFAAPMLAQADVKVSGQAHMDASYIDTLDGGPNSSQTKMWNVGSNASFFKIDGEEDLGGGMKAFASILEYVRMDNTANQNYVATTTSGSNVTRLVDGNAYAGLSGGFGKILLGSNDTPGKSAGTAVNLFVNQIGDTRNLDMDNNRYPNTVAYSSPNFAGVVVTAGHSTNVDNLSVTAGGNISANLIGVNYDGGPVSVKLAMDDLDKQGIAATEKWTVLSGAFKIGSAAKVVASVQKHEVSATTEGQTLGLGGSFTFGGGNTVKAQYTTYTLSVTGLPDVSSKMIALGFDHAFSKTTTGYVAVAKTDNDSGGTKTMAAGGHGDQPVSYSGGSQTGLALGVIVNF